MKKIFLFPLLVFLSTNSFAQMGIFQHLNEVKEEYTVSGRLEKIEDKDSYIYYVKDDSTATLYAYALTMQLYCYMTIAKPLSSESLQTWVQTLNNKWVIIDETNWLFYRTDGNILECKLSNKKDDETILMFTIKKIKKK